MKKEDFLRKFEALLELEQGALSGSEALTDLEAWDSLAVMALIAMVDESVGMVISPTKIAQAKTVDELMGLLGDKIVA